MPSLRVPDRYHAGILKLASLSPEEYSNLLDALKTAPPVSSSIELAKWIGDKVQMIAEPDRSRILSALASMYRVAKARESSAAEFASDVYQFFIEDKPDDVKGINQKEFVERFASVLELPALDVPSTKVNDLMSEVERGFCNARIVTDLRPVFRNNIDEGTSAMIVMHTLRLAFHQDSEHKEFYVTLDSQDLSSLRKVIERAERKESTLLQQIAKLGLKIYE